MNGDLVNVKLTKVHVGGDSQVHVAVLVKVQVGQREYFSAYGSHPLVPEPRPLYNPGTREDPYESLVT